MTRIQEIRKNALAKMSRRPVSVTLDIAYLLSELDEAVKLLEKYGPEHGMPADIESFLAKHTKES